MLNVTSKGENETYRSFSLSRSKKINRKLFSGIESRNCEDTSPSLRSVRSPKPQIFVEMFTELSMETPCWCTSDVHQHGGRKIVYTSGTYVGYLGD